MEYVLSNGNFYVKVAKTGRIDKVPNREEATKFVSIKEAYKAKAKAPAKTRGYEIVDKEQMQVFLKRRGRIYFPKEVRERVYAKADGKCALCGRKLLYEEMTLDHIVPLAMGGADIEKNLQCTCYACNSFKGSILPEDFMQRIRQIFMYQMGKKYGKRIGWKIVQQILERMD